MSPKRYRPWYSISAAEIPDWVRRAVKKSWSRKGGPHTILTVTVTGRTWEYRVKTWVEDAQGHVARITGSRRLRRRGRG